MTHRNYACGFAFAIAVTSASLVAPHAQADSRHSQSTIDVYVAPHGTTRSHTVTQCTTIRPCDLSTARRLVRAAIPSMRADIHVTLRPGEYQLSHPFVLGPQDSGGNGHQVVWQGSSGTVLTGGQHVAGWRTWRDGIWRAPVPAGTASRQFYVDGRRTSRASGPGSILGTATKTATGYTITDPTIAGWSNLADTEFVYTGSPGQQVEWEGWTERRCGVASVTRSDGSATVTMKQPCFDDAVHQGSDDQQGINNPTSIENNLALLDQPGEWYLDRTSNYVYYKPRPGENLHTADAILPTTQGILQLHGTPTDPIHNVTVKGMTFAYDTWLGPSSRQGYPDIQATVMNTADGPVLPPAAVTIQAGREISLLDNSFEHLGATGLAIRDGSQNITVRGNTLTDTSGSGITIGTVNNPNPPGQETDSRILVEDNYLHDLPAEYHDGVGIFAGYANSVLLRHNEIARTSYTGISVGWGWGVADNLGDNHIDDNYIHQVMQSQLFDGGAVYVNGLHSSSPRSTISGNYMTGDPQPYGETYLDGSVTNYDVTGNVIGDTTTNWIYIQTISGQVAKDNNVTGNYTDTNQMSSGWDPSNTVQDNHTGLTSWPPEAQQIIANAGLEPAYRHITREGP